MFVSEGDETSTKRDRKALAARIATAKRACRPILKRNISAKTMLAINEYELDVAGVSKNNAITENKSEPRLKEKVQGSRTIHKDCTIKAANIETF